MAPGPLAISCTTDWSMRRPVGREVQHGGGRPAAVNRDGRQRAQQRLGQHHHAGAAAIGAVVDAAVGVVGEIAQRPQAHVDAVRPESAAGDALRQVRREEFREQRDDIEAHGHSAFSSPLPNRR